MMNLINVGIRQDMPAEWQRRVRVNNLVAMMCFVIGFTYVFFIYAHYPPLAIYPFSLFMFSAFILLLNHMNLIHIARFVNAFQMLTLATLFQASIIQENEALLMSFYCAQLAMTIIPWVIFDLDEKLSLVLSLAICFGLLIAQQGLNSLIEVPVDVTFYREGYLTPMTYIFAILIEAACILMLISKFQEAKQSFTFVQKREEVLY